MNGFNRNYVFFYSGSLTLSAGIIVDTIWPLSCEPRCLLLRDPPIVADYSKDLQTQSRIVASSL